MIVINLDSSIATLDAVDLTPPLNEEFGVLVLQIRLSTTAVYRAFLALTYCLNNMYIWIDTKCINVSGVRTRRFLVIRNKLDVFLFSGVNHLCEGIYICNRTVQLA